MCTALYVRRGIYGYFRFIVFASILQYSQDIWQILGTFRRVWADLETHSFQIDHALNSEDCAASWMKRKGRRGGISSGTLPVESCTELTSNVAHRCTKQNSFFRFYLAQHSTHSFAAHVVSYLNNSQIVSWGNNHDTNENQNKNTLQISQST